MILSKNISLFSWALAAKIPAVIYGLVYLLTVMSELKVEEHGRFAIIWALFMYIVLFCKLLVLHPMIHFASDPARFKTMTRAGIQLNAFFYCVFIVLIFLLAPVLSEILRIDEKLLMFIPPLLIAMFFRETGYCIQQTQYRTSRLFTIDAVFFLGTAVALGWCTLNSGLDSAEIVLKIILWAAIASSSVAVLMNIKELSCLFGGVNFREILDLLRYGFFTMGIGFSAQIINGNVDVLLLGVFYKQREVGLYNGAKAVYRLVSQLSQAVSLVSMPYASKLIAEKKYTELKETCEKLVAYLGVTILVIVITGLLLANPVYNNLFGGKYAGSAIIFQILIIAAFFETIYTVTGNILYGAGKAASVAFVSIVAVVTWFVVSLTSIYTVGYIGVAIGLVLSMFIASVTQHFIAAEKLGIRLRGILEKLLNLRSFIKSSGD